jgi:uncharacterized protein (TIGR03437 family)
MALLADLSSTKTLTMTSGALNLDTGATATSGGDILWDGSTLTPQGTAKAVNIGPAGTITGLSKSFLDGLKPTATSAALSSSTLVVGDVFAVFTNGGNTAAVLVNANSGGSLTLQFTTFGAAGGTSGPTITNVLNNSSLIPAGFPNSGIAQGSLFQVLGSGLANPGDTSLHSSEGAGLQTSLNGATVSVTVGTVTKVAPLYYATPTQIDGVLSSSMPLGSGTVTVAFNGVTSASFPIQVVAAAPGITTFNGSGVAQHVNGTLVTYTASAAPGEVIILWGTGLGATANSDTTYDTSAHQTNVQYTIYIGGVQATNIAYAGASVYPGVGVFGVTVPSNAPTGCFVPVAAVANGNVVSNTVTIPVHAGGGVCSDPQLGYNGTQISTLNGKGTVKNGFLIVSQSTAPVVGVSNSASAIFQQTTGISSAGGGAVSIGGCIISQTTTGGSVGTTTGLNPGAITVTGPGGTPITLTGIPQVPGFFSATVPAIPSTGAAYVFNGSGGADVGGFSTTVSFPNPLLVWANQNAASTVGRNQGLTVSWTGGAPGTYVMISGSSASGTVSGGYTCIAPQTAGTFTVPSYILQSLPAGTGTTTVQNSTNFSTFSATGLDFGGSLGSVSFTVNSTYN